MKSLITGITGFVGSHLAELLLREGEEVIGVSRRGVWIAGAEHLARRIPVMTVDVANSDGLSRLLAEHRPQQVYHLAGQANVPQSVRDPAGTWNANFVGSRSLFDAVAQAIPRARILLVSSGQVYGQPAAEDLPVTEEAPLRPVDPYPVSKAAVDLLASQYVRERGADIVIARPFNHIGPRQKSAFAVAHFALQIAQVERHERPPSIAVGQLTGQRDFTDVRDVVRAYHQIMREAQPADVFNIASGISRPVGDLLECLIRLSSRAIEVVQDPSLMRRNDPLHVQVSPAKLMSRTGWRPQYPLENSLRDILEYWRQTPGDANTTPASELEPPCYQADNQRRNHSGND